MNIDKHFSNEIQQGAKKKKKRTQMATLGLSQAYEGGLAFKSLYMFTTA